MLLFLIKSSWILDIYVFTFRVNMNIKILHVMTTLSIFNSKSNWGLTYRQSDDVMMWAEPHLFHLRPNELQMKKKKKLFIFWIFLLSGYDHKFFVLLTSEC